MPKDPKWYERMTKPEDDYGYMELADDAPPLPPCPPAYGGCTCPCHRTPGIMHVVACCHPRDDGESPFVLPYGTLTPIKY